MRCLNLKVTYRCTNRCRFCFSSNERGNDPTPEFLFAAVERGRRNGCRELVLSGGEPTLEPSLCLRLLDLASRTGYTTFILQTNGAGISSDPAFRARLFSFAETHDLAISFSVHGHNAELHDEASETPGAFQCLTCALSETAVSRSRLYTNTVVSARNIQHLREIANRLFPFHPEVMQFAVMHLDSPDIIAPGLVATARAVRSLSAFVPEHVLRTEGIPFCLMHGLERCVGESQWPEHLDLCNKNGDYREEFDQLRCGMRCKPEFCGRCVMKEVCMGVWREHLAELDQSGIHSIC